MAVRANKIVTFKLRYMNQKLDDNFLKDENGDTRGHLFVAFTNIQESNGLKIQADEHSLNLLINMEVGTELCCASSNDSSVVVSVDGLNIQLDKPMFTANEPVLKRGEIIIIKDESYYNAKN